MVGGAEEGAEESVLEFGWETAVRVPSDVIWYVFVSGIFSMTPWRRRWRRS